MIQVVALEFFDRRSHINLTLWEQQPATGARGGTEGLASNGGLGQFFRGMRICTKNCRSGKTADAMNCSEIYEHGQLCFEMWGTS